MTNLVLRFVNRDASLAPNALCHQSTPISDPPLQWISRQEARNVPILAVHMGAMYWGFVNRTCKSDWVRSLIQLSRTAISGTLNVVSDVCEGVMSVWRSFLRVCGNLWSELAWSLDAKFFERKIALRHYQSRSYNEIRALNRRARRWRFVWNPRHSLFGKAVPSAPPSEK